MQRSIPFVMLLLGLVLAFGCSSSPTMPLDQSAMDAVFAGVELPSPEGVVGSYTYTSKDGSMETGDVIRDENGTLTFLSDRGASIIANSWFDIEVEYLNPRGYWWGSPLYIVGDTVEYCIDLTYNRGMPLDQYPVLYSTMTTEQRFYPSMKLLPGDAIEVWDPLAIPPYSQFRTYDEYFIPYNCPHGWGCTTCIISIEFMGGWLNFEVQWLVMGVWDP